MGQMDFFTDGQFLIVSRELVFTSANITYTSCVMAEKEKERKSPHWGKLQQGKVTNFFEIFVTFPYKIFS